MLPSAAGAPALGVLVDRWRREVVLRVAYGVQAAACLAMAAAYSAGMPLVVLFVLLAVEGFVSVLIQPAVTALVPWLARSPLELTAANAGLSVGRAAGICIGPLLAGTLTETVGAGSALAAGGLLMSASTLFALGLRVPAGARTGPAPRRGAGSFAHEMSVGFRALVSDRGAGSIAALLASAQGLLRGLFSVLADRAPAIYWQPPASAGSLPGSRYCCARGCRAGSPTRSPVGSCCGPRRSRSSPCWPRRFRRSP